MTRQPVISKGQTDRTLWVDAAKGLCIILVVLFHSTLGVEKDIGHVTWMHTVIEWAKPFRMPDFFLISGLFLSARIARPWREFLDAKVWHFAYFYILWFHIHFGLRLKGTIAEAGSMVRCGNTSKPTSIPSVRCGSSTCWLSSASWRSSSTGSPLGS